jgi:phosphoglycerate kinase
MPTGRSLVESDLVAAAADLLTRAADRHVELDLPVDHVVAAKIDEDADAETIGTDDPAIGDRMGLDIGPATVERFAAALRGAKTVVWNGPMGVFEIAKFARGTIGVARAVAAVDGTTIVGGGDSVAAVSQAGVAGRMTHISTGGGASLEFLGGRELPCVKVLS